MGSTLTSGNFLLVLFPSPGNYVAMGACSLPAENVALRPAASTREALLRAMELEEKLLKALQNIPASSARQARKEGWLPGHTLAWYWSH